MSRATDGLLEPAVGWLAGLAGVAEQYCVGSEQVRVVGLEGRMIIHSEPLQHRPASPV